MHAILIVDMAGFTEAFRAEGVTGAIARVRQLRRDGITAVDLHGGRMFKTSGDNLFALFDAPEAALAAALALRRANATACSAVGWGELMLADGDLFGMEMNLASRLAEDLARAGDVLLTEDCALALGRPANLSTLFKARTVRWAAA